MAVFQDVYETYGKPVYRFLLSLTGEEGQAEELLQETFYQAFLHMDRFQGRSSLYTWLCQIGKNAWLKECRRKKRFDAGALEDLELADSRPLPEQDAIRRDQCRRVRAAVYRLAEPYRSVLVMHLYGEQKLKEIAALFGKSESWGKVTYYRAKAKLLEALEKEELS